MRKAGAVTAVLALVLLSGGRLAAAPAPRTNVILVVIDALAKSHLQSFGYFRETSPFLLELSGRSVLFTDAVAASSHTAPSVASILTGKFPYRNGVQYFRDRRSFHPAVPIEKGGFPRLGLEHQAVFEPLKDGGYATIVVQTNPWLRSEYGFAQGVDHYRYIETYDGAPVLDCFFNEILPGVGEAGFFAYLHFMDVHNPYYKPGISRGLYARYEGEPVYDNEAFPGLSEEDLAYTVAFYDEGIRYVDGILKTLFDRLAENGLSERTLVIIAADHGEEFFEHGGLGHGRTCYNEVKDSFILLCHPGLSGRRIETRVSLVDIFPTILDRLGAGYRKSGTDGISLWPLVEGRRGPKNRTVFSELGDSKAILRGGLETIYHLEGDRWEVFDLRTDREELHPIPPKTVAEFPARLRLMRKVFNEAARRVRSSAAVEAEYRRLRSLGYIK